jgi:hypothetical protein
MPHEEEIRYYRQPPDSTVEEHGMESALEHERNLRRVTRTAVAAALLIVTALVVPLPVLRADETQSGVRPTLLPASSGPSLPENDPRRSLRITLVLDKEEYFLGENVILHYHIENPRNDVSDRRGPEKGPFSLSIGGNMSFSDWDAQFKVEAIDQTGRKAEDWYPGSGSWPFGGMGGIKVLKPGDEFWDDLQLMKYREPGRAGACTIKVYHDLGWGGDKNLLIEIPR